MAETISFTEEELQIDLADLMTGRGFITGKSGSGKSNTAGKIAEEILDKGYPLMVIDIEGEYYGLKEQHEILHVGADEECDLQVGPEHAQKIAELALEKSIPIILDVSGYIETSEVDQLVHDTCKAMFDKEKKMKKPFPIFVEEAHEFIPQQGSRGEDGEVSNMLIRIGKRGRKRGLGLCALSQRPQSVDKDFITQSDYKIWHRLDWDTELKVVGKVLGKEYKSKVKALETGEAYLQTDFLENEVERIHVLKKKTFDAGATPDLEGFEKPDLKSVSSDLVNELEEISEKKKQEQNRIEQLQEKLEEKDEEIEELEEELERAQDMSNMAEQFTQAMASGGNAEVEEKVDEIREEKNERIRELEKEKDSLEEKLEDLEAENSDLQERVNELEEYEEAQQHMDELKEAVSRMNEALGLETQDKTDQKLKKKVKQKEQRIQELEKKVSSSDMSGQEDFIGSDKYQRKAENLSRRTKASKEGIDQIMKELKRDPATPGQLGKVTGLSTATVKHNYLSPLKSEGWVKKSGSKYQLTEEVKQ